MASDRHGKHNKPTISFRVTPYEQQVINERVKASGMKKQDLKCYIKVVTGVANEI